ncbi:hypothetical protein FGB62_96g10 [Gracilaria domingensis]|nr:hypothetical protein FGB62_96g10 [Gracilaria domingensis]
METKEQEITAITARKSASRFPRITYASWEVCSLISNDASLGGVPWSEIDRQRTVRSISPSSPAKGPAVAPVKAVKAVHLKPVARQNNRNPLTNQIQFVLSLMGQVAASLRSAVISNTIDAAKRNGGLAVGALQQLEVQVLELVSFFPDNDRALADVILDQFSDALLLLIARLEMALAGANTLQAVKDACQGIIDQIAQSFWTRGQVALNGYVAFWRFTNDWGPWVNAVRVWIANN